MQDRLGETAVCDKVVYNRLCVKEAYVIKLCERVVCDKVACLKESATKLCVTKPTRDNPLPKVQPLPRRMHIDVYPSRTAPADV